MEASTIIHQLVVQGSGEKTKQNQNETIKTFNIGLHSQGNSKVGTK